MKSLPNILIVDDNPDHLTYLEIVLKPHKIRLIKAGSGLEALKKIANTDLALAIIDVRMPGMNGYELAMKMNEEKSGEKVPIIFITANYVDEMQLFKGYGSGAVDFIFKPINNDILYYKAGISRPVQPEADHRPGGSPAEKICAEADRVKCFA